MSYDENEINCWICKEKMVNPVIKYCDCAGDISNVHYDCLANWNIESNSKECRWCERKFDYIKKVDYLILLKLIFSNVMTFIFWGSMLFYWVMVSILIKTKRLYNYNDLIPTLTIFFLTMLIGYDDYKLYKKIIYDKSKINKLLPV